MAEEQGKDLVQMKYDAETMTSTVKIVDYGKYMYQKSKEDIYLTHPDIKIEAFASGFSDKELGEFIFPVRQDNGVSQHFKINSYPTILIFNKKKEKYFISGYVDKDKILGLLKGADAVLPGTHVTV